MKQQWKPGNMLYPLPAVMVSCARAGEKPNIITLAWVGTICSDPAMVSVSIRPERYSYGIIRETGEFVINLTTRALARAADFAGVRSGRDLDKFEKTGLTARPAPHLNCAPLIEESPVNIECRVTEVKELGSHHMFLAEVVGVSVDEAYLDARGRLDLKGAGLVAYSHGTYLTLGEEIGTFGFSVRRAADKKAAGGAAQAKPKKPEAAHAEAKKSRRKEGQKNGAKEKHRIDRDAGRGQEHHRRHSGQGAGEGLHRRRSGDSEGGGKAAARNH